MIRVLEEMLAHCLFITIPVLFYEIMAFSDSVESTSSVHSFLVRSRLADINIFYLLLMLLTNANITIIIAHTKTKPKIQVLRLSTQFISQCLC